MLHSTLMSSDEKDRRLDPRVASEEIRIEFLSPIPRVRDLSTSGLYLLDPRPLQRGQTVELRLAFDAGEPVVVRGMVRRIDPGLGMGIEFIHIDAAARRRVKHYISHNDPKKVSPAGRHDV
jgi:hypothetical protein